MVTFERGKAVKLLLLCFRWYDIVSEKSEHLTLRAESVNYVNCHIQEIPENGADMRHFDYIH